MFRCCDFTLKNPQSELKFGSFNLNSPSMTSNTDEISTQPSYTQSRLPDTGSENYHTRNVCLRKQLAKDYGVFIPEWKVLAS